MNTQTTQTTLREISRGYYNEINMCSLPAGQSDAAHKLVARVGNIKKVDEHGNWDFGVESNRKGAVSALNWDLYGIGNDCHGGGLLIVIQVRQFERKKANYYPSIRKNYFLIGTNEDETVFAHTVASAVIHSAIRRGVDVIKAVQDWIFNGDYSGMIRQGDLALIPCTRRPSAPKVANRVMILEKSHRLKANAIRQNGTLYAKNPHLVHVPATHPEVQGENRWYKVVIGKRAAFWKFAAPTID